MKNVGIKWVVILGIVPLVLLGLLLYSGNLYNNYDYILTAGYTGLPLSSDESQLAFYSFTSENDTHDISFVLFTNIPDVFSQQNREADRDTERTNRGLGNTVGAMVGGTNRHYRGYSGYIEYRDRCEEPVCEPALAGEIGDEHVKINGEKYDLGKGRVFVAQLQGDEVEIEQIPADATPDEYFVVYGEHRQEKIEELFDTLNITALLSE